MLIRPMELTDIDQVVHLENQTWTNQETPAQLPITNKEKLLEAFEHQTHFLLAEQQGQIVGVLDYRPYYSFPSGRFVVTFEMVVRTSLQRQGIGRQLLQMFLKEAKEDGYRKVVIHVLSTNAKAQLFYQKQGFSLEAHLSHLFDLEGQMVDDLIYTYDLEESHAR